MAKEVEIENIVMFYEKISAAALALDIIIKLKTSLKQFYYMSYVNFHEERAPSRIIYQII